MKGCIIVFLNHWTLVIKLIRFLSGIISFDGGISILHFFRVLIRLDTFVSDFKNALNLSKNPLCRLTEWDIVGRHFLPGSLSIPKAICQNSAVGWVICNPIKSQTYILAGFFWCVFSWVYFMIFFFPLLKDKRTRSSWILILR